MDNLIPSVKILIEQVILKAQSDENKSYDFNSFHTDFPNAGNGEYYQVFQNITKFDYAKRLYSNHVVYLTTKGEKFKSFKHEERKNWFKNLPSENWLLAKTLESIITHIVAIVIGILLGWYAHSRLYQYTHQATNKQSLSTNDSSSYKKYK